MKNICFTQCGRWPPLGSAHPPGATCSASGCTRRGVHAPVAHIVRTGARSFAQGAAPGPIAVGVSPLEVLAVPSRGPRPHPAGNYYGRRVAAGSIKLPSR